MLSNNLVGRQLSNEVRLERVHYSPHFDLPILRQQPRHRLRMLLCIRCFFIALGVATVVTIIVRSVYG